jgi:Flp pilus assembly pilin Flp
MQKPYNRLAHEDGQTMAEYATVLTVITIAAVTAIALLAAANADVIGRVAAIIV